LTTIHYDGWLCGNDSRPAKIKKKYRYKINKEVFGFNTLAKKISENEKNWECFAEEYRIKGKIDDVNLAMKAWDYYIKIDNRNILVEFDGAQHYSKILNYIRDEKYEKLARSLGYEVVRIPYFIQLDTGLVEYYFKTKLVSTKITHSFLQGFRINGKTKIPEFENTDASDFVNSMKYGATLPTEYHYFGLKRFEKEMQELSQNELVTVVDEIIDSLRCRAKDFVWDEKYTIPEINWY